MAGTFQTTFVTRMGCWTGAVGVYNMTGGVANINTLTDGTSDSNFVVGWGDSTGGYGNINIANSAHMTLNPGNQLVLSWVANSIGILNLGAVGSTTDASVLTVSAIRRGGTTGILNFHGGTLQASANNATFLNNGGGF